ncbi:XK-related protein 7 [Panthera pardus]|uniref:XK-related protein n=2 Tax=Panthera TaxID=9688 RepID=A0A8C8XFM0_PANLE|nr:XK-related protein 7 [Panthera leo]XP_049506900.1 XK-related protein 7 [Panthera uncia]XP_053746333.1 XK-related protein 7 [Panthera pardus]XP_058541201.1 XK-related protein 7 [Neofelis nebulosa]XP_060470922.1 XK-related protein 7 [Panthera onca]
MAAKSDGAAAAAGPGPEGAAGGARGGAGGRGEAAAAVAGGPGVTGAGGSGPRYELRDCCWVLCALLVFFSDGATDLWLAASYYLQGQRTYFGLTLLFVLLPSLVVQLLSFRWFVYDYSEPAGAPGPAVSTKDSGTGGPSISTKDSAAAFRTKEGSPQLGPGPAPSSASAYRRRCCRLCVWLLQTLVHLLQLGQVWRYLRAMYLGLQSRWRGERLRRHFYWRMLFESADVSMLRLLETFLRSAPQLVLQLSLLVHRGGEPDLLPALSTSASLVSLAWTLASYQKVLRDSRDDKRPLSYKGAVAQVLWHLFTIAARSLAFALFASVYKLYFGIFIVAHWCVMTFWVIQGETDFCMSKWEEIIYNMVVGIIYIFCWFNVKEGRSRRRMTLYYCIVLLENAALTGFWYSSRNFSTDFHSLILVCVVASSFALGIFFMCVYYCLLHPNGPMLGPQMPGCICPEAPGPCGPPADAVTSPPRSLPRTTGTERDGASAGGERAGTPTPPVFQVRPGLPPTPVARTLRTEGPVIRIDLPRKKYPAWDAHFIDRRLRKTILALEYSSPATPRLQYRSVGTSQELLEYETTV